MALSNPIKIVGPEEITKHWYIPVIRDILSVYKFDGVNYSKLAKQLTPKITDLDAEGAINILERIGMIRKDNGYYKQSEPNIKMEIQKSNEIQVKMLKNYHCEVLETVKEAYTQFGKNEREMSVHKLNINKESYNGLVDLIEETKDQLWMLADMDDNSDRTYRSNFQLFPVNEKRNYSGKIDDSVIPYSKPLMEHMKFMDDAKKAQMYVSPDERYIITLTMDLSQRQFEEGKQIMKEYNSKLSDIAMQSNGDGKKYIAMSQFIPTSELILK